MRLRTIAALEISQALHRLAAARAWPEDRQDDELRATIARIASKSVDDALEAMAAADTRWRASKMVSK